MADTSSLAGAEGASAARKGLPFFRNEYNAVLTLLTATLCLSFPVASYAVFGAGADRVRTAELLAITFVATMAGLFVAPWLPFPALRGETRYRRLERTVYIWVLVHTLTALTWEIPWMLLHERIAAARDELWAYSWWAYIDGGDTRYLDPNWLVFYVEGWADTNGVLALVALVIWLRSGKTNPLPIYYFMFAAPLHIYPTVLYYVSEIAEGLPNVDTTSAINLYVKFVMANSFWVILPFFVLVWGKQTLERIYRERYADQPAV
jgi:hypothetical protein